MDLRWVAVLCVVFSAGLAGCSSKRAADPGPSDDLSSTTGTVVGLITDDESQPVERAQISLKAIKVSPIAIHILTNSEGRFRLEQVPAGKQTVIVEKDGFLDGSTTITVVPGSETSVRVVLKSKPITTFRIEAHTPIRGQYTCAAEYVTFSGPCEYEIENHTGTNPGTYKNNISFEVPPDWGGLLFEISWTTGAPTPTIQGLRFQLESQEDNGGMFIKADVTENPVRIELNAGQVSPDATLGYPIPQRGVKTWIHILPLGYAEGATCQVQCGYGVGGAVQVSFTVCPTVFYGGQVDRSYSCTNG